MQFYFFRYLSLDTTFSQIEFSVTERTVTFYSSSYIQALNGLVGNGKFQCTLKSGGQIQSGVSYNTLEDFESCSVVDGGFLSGALSSTFNDTSLWALTGYNGQCSVFYGPTASIVSEPLVSNTLSVGGKVFYRLGDVSCTMGK